MFSAPISSEMTNMLLRQVGTMDRRIIQILTDAAIQWRFRGKNKENLINCKSEHDKQAIAALLSEDISQISSRLAGRAQNSLTGRCFRRLSADRNIWPELDARIDAVAQMLDSHGTGATNIIQNYLNQAALPRELIEKTLLVQISGSSSYAQLNDIFRPSPTLIAFSVTSMDISTLNASSTETP